MEVSGVRISCVISRKIVLELVRMEVGAHAELLLPLQLAADGGKEQMEIDRLGQIIVAPHLLPCDDAFGIAVRGEEEERHMLQMRQGTDMRKEVEAVLSRHGDVRDNDVRRGHIQMVDRLLHAPRQQHGEVLRLQDGADDLQQTRFVIHQQYDRLPFHQSGLTSLFNTSSMAEWMMPFVASVFSP